MFSIKFLCAAVLLAAVTNVHSMRCGTHLINEGGNVSHMLSLCGQPTYSNFSTYYYENKDGDGMHYIVHVNSSGFIDNIEFNREE